MKNSVKIVQKFFVLLLVASVLFPFQLAFAEGDDISSPIKSDIAVSSVSAVSSDLSVTSVKPITSSGGGDGGSNGQKGCERVDMNNDGTINPADFYAFQSAFLSGDMRADFDQNGSLNVNDYVAFMNAYASCPHTPPVPVCDSARLDMNNDGVLNTADFVAFQDAFQAGNMRADFDQNGSLNVNDFVAFNNAFAKCRTSTNVCVRADFNNDGKLSTADFYAFQSAFLSGDMRADFDQSGSLNVNDYTAFLNAYAACTNGGTSTRYGVTVSPLSGSTSENGSGFTFVVTLDSIPNAPVSINLTSTDTSEGTVSPATIVLNPENITAVVSVAGVDDSTVDGNISYSIVTSKTISVDPNYNNLEVPDISVVNSDDDVEEPAGGGGGSGSSGSSGGGSSGGQGRIFGGAGEVLGASTINTGACNFISGFLKRGENNNMIEVMKLQSFLKTFEGFKNVEMNGKFDEVTFNAVSAFQKKYGTEVLEPWGYSKDHSTGYVYILTKNKINEIYCKKTIPLTSAEQKEISEFSAMMKNLAIKKIN